MSVPPVQQFVPPSTNLSSINPNNNQQRILKSTLIDDNKNTLNTNTNNNSIFTMSNGLENQDSTLHMDNFDDAVLPVLPGSHVPLKN